MEITMLLNCTFYYLESCVYQKLLSRENWHAFKADKSKSTMHKGGNVNVDTFCPRSPRVFCFGTFNKNFTENKRPRFGWHINVSCFATIFFCLVLFVPIMLFVT